MESKIILVDYPTPYGELIIGSYDDQLCICDWKYRARRKQIDDRIQNLLNATMEYGSSKVNELTKSQLQEYFNQERTEFTIPLLLVGTEFQKMVWNALLEIPYGETMSYLDLAKSLQNEGAIRAIASANGANSISIIVPCHRVIGADGELTGYAGGLATKKKLLMLEGALNTHQLRLFPE